MGWWKSQHGTIGDWPADIMDKALAEIEDAFLHDTGRPPTQGELADLIEFCTAGCLKAECGDPKHPYSKSLKGDEDTPRARERGYQGAMGPASVESTKAGGGMANVDPSTGDHFKGPKTEKHGGYPGHFAPPEAYGIDLDGDQNDNPDDEADV